MTNILQTAGGGKLRIAYERLSRDDEASGDSLSIQNQKMLLEDFAAQKGYDGLTHIADDGWSGTRWDRPGIVRLMDELERDNVELVLVKDMSRLGRDHLRVGLLLEKFHELGVHFIAVADGVDTARSDDDFTPFRNIINEWVARDTSKKIRDVNNARTKDGKHVSGAVPYGYLRDPGVKSKWVLDEEAAPIVRRMFESVIQGKTVTQIARELSAEGVLTPSAHWQEIGAGMRSFPSANPTKWPEATIIGILKKEEYMGWCVLNKTVKETYKSKRKPNAPENILVFKDAHPAIVDEEMWNVVQRLRETRRRPQRIGGDAYPLTGILYCADCGHKMHYKQGKSDKTHKPHHEYMCSSYRHYSRNCTMHYIRVEVVEEIILAAIRRVSGYVRKHEAEFVRRVREESALQQEASVKEGRRKLNALKRRREEVSALIKKLYEAFATDKIPEEHFTELLTGYGAERSSLDGDIGKLQAEIDSYNSDTLRTDKFIELVRHHAEFAELTPELLNEFVERVIVHEAVKDNGVRTQDIEIFFAFIGKFELLENENQAQTAPPAKATKKLRRDMTGEELATACRRDKERYDKKRAARIAAEKALRESVLKGTSFENKVDAKKVS